MQHPADARLLTDVDNPHFFTRDPTTKRIHVLPRTKQYSLVFDKRVVDPATYMSHPYGHKPFFTPQDEEMAHTLLTLQDAE